MKVAHKIADREDNLSLQLGEALPALEKVWAAKEALERELEAAMLETCECPEARRCLREIGEYLPDVWQSSSLAYVKDLAEMSAQLFDLREIKLDPLPLRVIPKDDPSIINPSRPVRIPEMVIDTAHLVEKENVR